MDTIELVFETFFLLHTISKFFLEYTDEETNVRVRDL